MAINIGPKIGIDGEAQFRKELNNIIQQAKTLESEMKAVTSSFDENVDSQEKLEAQAKVLNQQIEVQDKRVEMLEQGLREAAKKFGDTATQTLKWEQALNEAKTTSNNMHSQLSKLENGVEDVTEELEDAEKASFGFGDAFAANLLAGSIIEGVKNLAGAIGDLADETMEYRKIMASLEISSERAGYTAEQTSEIYKGLYGVLGDEQTAATTTANLQAIGLEQEQLIEVTNAAIGAWATYGDSIPIDGLAESINETIQAGTVTGNFADVLNWAGTSEDEFNEKLAASKDVTERTNIVLNELAKQGLAEAGKAWQESNEDIVEANKSTADFQEITADLAKKFSPASTAVQDGFNKILRSASDMVDESDIEDFSEVLEDIADFVADDVLPVIKNLFDFIIDNKDYVISGLAGIGSAVAAWKIATTIKKVTDGIKALTTGVEGATFATKLLNGAWSTSPIGVVATTIGLVTTALGFLTIATNNETEAMKLAREEAENNRIAMEEANQAYWDAKAARSEAAEAELVQIENARVLVEELKTLADENGRVTEANKIRAEYILGQLNEALGTEFTMTGNQIDQYKTLEDQVYKTIEAKKTEILMNQALESYEEALKNISQAEKNYYTALEEYSARKQKIAEIEKKIDEISIENAKTRSTAKLTELGKERAALEAQLISEQSLLAQKETAYNSAKNTLDGIYQDMSLYSQAYTLSQQGETEKLLALLERQNDGFKTAEGTVNLSAQEQKRVLREQYEQSLVLLNNYRESYKEGMDGYSEETLKRLELLAEDARKEAEKVGINVGDGTLAGLEKSNGQIVADSIAIGANIVSGISLGVNNNKNQLSNAIIGVANVGIAAAKKTLGIHSPSKVFEEIGKFSAEGFEIGIYNEMDKAYQGISKRFQNTTLALSNSTLPFFTQAGTGHVYNDNAKFEIIINAAPGQSEDVIADVVMQKIQNAVQRKGAVFQ